LDLALPKASSQRHHNRKVAVGDHAHRFSVEEFFHAEKAFKYLSFGCLAYFAADIAFIPIFSS
jgi:hypothetical protein